MTEFNSERPTGREPPRIAGLENLDMEREPHADLWPAIQARMAQRTMAPVRLPPPRRRWLPLAAAACITAAIAGLIGLHQMQSPAPPAPAAVTTVSPGTTVVLSAENDQPAMPRLQGSNRALVKANLKIIKSAEDELRQALSTDPDDRYLQSLLLSTQTQQNHLRGLLDRNRV